MNGTEQVQQVQAAIEQVLALRAGFQRLGHTTDVSAGPPADALAQLVQVCKHQRAKVAVFCKPRCSAHIGMAVRLSPSLPHSPE